MISIKLSKVDLFRKKSGLKAEFLPSEKYFIRFNDSLLKMMKIAFYFILKALFILKIFRFLSWLFGNLEKTALLRR